jgi:hypothetical protein
MGQCRQAPSPLLFDPAQPSHAVSAARNGWTDGPGLWQQRRVLKSKIFRFRASAQELAQELFPLSSSGARTAAAPRV